MPVCLIKKNYQCVKDIKSWERSQEYDFKKKLRWEKQDESKRYCGCYWKSVTGS